VAVPAHDALCLLQESSCRSRNSLLSVCVRRKVPSDENLHELCRRPAAVYAPLPRWPRYPPPAPPPPELCHYDDDVECSYFRRRPRTICNAAAASTDPKKYTWMTEDEESTRMVSVDCSHCSLMLASCDVVRHLCVALESLMLGYIVHIVSLVKLSL
jgi:hypothetical protein